MPRTLNAKQAATAHISSKTTGIPPPFVPFILYSAANSRDHIVLRGDMLSTPFPINTGPLEHWVLVPAEEEGTFNIKHFETDQFVEDGHRPNPVAVGPGEPVVVRISADGEDRFVIKAPYEDLLWTYIPLRPWGRIVYQPSNGTEYQAWRFVLDD